MKKKSSIYIVKPLCRRKTLYLFGLIISLFISLLALKPLKTTGQTLSEDIKEDPHSFTQKEILTYSEIDSVLNTIQKVPYYQLDKEYFTKIGYYGRPDEYKVSNRSFYKLVGEEVFKNLVGKHKVNEFLPKDKAWKEIYNISDTNYIQYFLIDKEVLYRFLDLIILLNKSGYNTDSLKIMDGYRYPAFNDETGGAGFSQHLYGKAIDIEVGDINNDHIFDEKTDKKIVIELLDKKVIKKSGGIGLYPGTQIVHFDTRGKYARWNEQ